MRPIDKGSSPVRGEFNDYTEAHPYLIQRLGVYCSYCERRIEVMLAVEHMSPKTHCKKEERKWRNFLLACVQCNSSKKDTNIQPHQLRDYVWPDRDDTFHMIDYLPINAYRATPVRWLNGLDKRRVGKTIGLVNINSHTNKYGATTYKNKLVKRQEVAQVCIRMKKAYLKARKLLKKYPNDPDVISNYDSSKMDIVTAAKFSGCWSIWMQYFEGIPEIREILLDFPGTNRQYFH